MFFYFVKTEQLSERNELLKRLVFPALLSDFLHFIYESLENSRKGKLAITFALLRKPIQENMFLFELIAENQNGFAEDLVADPLRLRPKNAGGIEGHVKRIHNALNTINKIDLFDADYIAQLRYAKTDDGFDGICNQSMHLITEHKEIRTESMNINLIFSDYNAHITQ